MPQILVNVYKSGWCCLLGTVWWLLQCGCSNTTFHTQFWQNLLCPCITDQWRAFGAYYYYKKEKKDYMITAPGLQLCSLHYRYPLGNVPLLFFIPLNVQLHSSLCWKLDCGNSVCSCAILVTSHLFVFTCFRQIEPP